MSEEAHRRQNANMAKNSPSATLSRIQESILEIEYRLYAKRERSLVCCMFRGQGDVHNPRTHPPSPLNLTSAPPYHTNRTQQNSRENADFACLNAGGCHPIPIPLYRHDAISSNKNSFQGAGSRTRRKQHKYRCVRLRETLGQKEDCF